MRLQNFSADAKISSLFFNLSNEVTDTLESSEILIYFETRTSLYT
jgi:hypothetical protein